MAGDWIKFEKSLADKPEVIAISSITGLDRFGVVGRLMEIWAWFDSHTEDGNAVGVTKAFLDSKVSVTGFADSLLQVGWLENIHEGIGGLKVANFHKHNGKTAKKRAKTNERVSKHRNVTEKKQECNASSVTKSVTREEKRREDITTTTTDVRDPLTEVAKRNQTIISQPQPENSGVTLIQGGKTKFPMYDEWTPCDSELGYSCAAIGVAKSDITTSVIKEFAYYWRCNGGHQSEDEWIRRMVRNFKRKLDLEKNEEIKNVQRKQTNPSQKNYKSGKYTDIQDILDEHRF